MIADAHRELAAEMRSRWVVGTADSVRAELEQLAATYACQQSELPGNRLDARFALGRQEFGGLAKLS